MIDSIPNFNETFFSALKAFDGVLNYKKEQTEIIVLNTPGGLTLLPIYLG